MFSLHNAFYPLTMNSSLATPSQFRTAASEPKVAAPRSIDSRDLLPATGELQILHLGETYRLRQTRQGKLILTK